MSPRTTWLRSFLSLSLCLGFGLGLLSCEALEPCSNAVQDGDETDIDCGGGCATRCQPGLGCQLNSDCDSRVCTSHQCAAPTCEDKQRNGQETDVDCGGQSGCRVCDDFQKCASDSDCKSAGCVRGICAPSLVRDVSPVRGERSGGTVVTLRGPGLTSKVVSEVRFGGQAATGLSQGQDGVVQVTTPSQATAGLVDVTVAFSDGSKSALPAGFRYYYGKLQFTTAFKFIPSALGPNCRSMAVADFNGDGKSDLALFCGNYRIYPYTNLEMQTWISNGDGTFRLVASQPMADPTLRAVVLDFNQDGKQDVAVAVRTTEGKLGIFRGNGDGSFAPPTYLAVGPYPLPLAAADFDQDGFTDLLTITQDSPQRCLFRNLRGMGFGQRECAPYQDNPTIDAAIGDFDRNGGLDVASGVRDVAGGTVIVSLNNSNGYFTRDIGIGSLTSYYAMYAFDVNQDGISDLVASSYPGAPPWPWHVRLGLGDGTFQAPRVAHSSSTSYQGFSAAVADYDADGRLDFAGAGVSYLTSVLLNKTGDGTFTLGADLATDLCYAISSGDFDGDGRVDIAEICERSGTVNVFLNRSE